MHLIQEIGSYAGFAAVVGLAVLSALYFSQARDVKRLREWAGRAPERAAEAEARGRVGTISAQRVVAEPRAKPAPASPVATPAATGAQQAAKEPAQLGTGEHQHAAAASPSATPIPAASPSATPIPAASPSAMPIPAASPIARAPAAAAAAAAGVATATPEAGTAAASPAAPPAPAEPAVAPGNGGNAGPNTGAKVLPPRPSPPPRPTFTRPPEGSRNLGHTAVMTPPVSSATERRMPPRRYMALIVAGLIVLGIGAAVGVVALTDNGTKSSTNAAASGSSSGGHHKKKKKKQNFAPAIDPSTVTVAVLNGTSVPGLAAKAGGRVQSAGFKLGNVTNAPQGGQRTESVVMFKQGGNREARAVARRMGISQIEPIDASASTLSGAASVVVVVGADQINR